jgi:hypothetical protein
MNLISVHCTFPYDTGLHLPQASLVLESDKKNYMALQLELLEEAQKRIRTKRYMKVCLQYMTTTRAAIVSHEMARFC